MMFTAWREKMWVFLHEPQQRTDLKFADQLLKMKSTTSQTVFHVIREVAHNLFRRARREILFHRKIDWQLNLTGNYQRVYSFSIVTS